MRTNQNIKAIIWDYDGTLVDTRHKNMNVTKRIIASIAETDALVFPALQSVENYHLANRRTSNWRELYRQEFNLSEKQVDEAGRLWTAYQLADVTEVFFYRGIETVIRDLGQFPHGIVSQNSRSSITRDLAKNNLLPYFKQIVGYEEVDLNKQKPDPAGLLSCLEKLCPPGPGSVCYIGDHETDVQCVQAANHALQAENAHAKIFSIGVCYDSGVDTSTWNVRPDYEAHTVEHILEIVDHIGRS